MNEDVCCISNEIEILAKELNILVCDKGYNFEPLIEDLKMARGYIKKSISDIEINKMVFQAKFNGQLH